MRKDAAERKNKKKEKHEKDSSQTGYVAECTHITAMSCELTESSCRDEDEWFLDSGASRHLCHRKEWFNNLKQLSIPGVVRVGNSQIIYALAKGDIMLKTVINGKWKERTLYDVWYVPKLTKNLLSVSGITKQGSVYINKRDRCEIMRDGEVYSTGSCTNGIYKMNIKVVKPVKICEANISETTHLQVWHERLAHQNKRHVRKFLSMQGIDCEDNDEFCEGCIYGKLHRSSYGSRPTKSTRIGELISTDVCGPMEAESLGGCRYYIEFKDDYSKFRKVYFVRNKSEATVKTRDFIKFAQSQGHVIHNSQSCQIRVKNM